MPKDKVIYCTAEQWFKGYPFQVIRIANRKYIQQWHYHDYVQIWYVKKGQCLHYFNGSEYTLSKGDIFILPPMMQHKIISEDEENTVLLECGFLKDFISADENSGYEHFLSPFLIEQDIVKPLFSLDGDAVKEIEKIFDELMYEYEYKEKYFDSYIKADILKILSIIARKYNKSIGTDKSSILDKHKEAILGIIDHLSENPDKRMYIEEACKKTNMSSTHFSYVFKQITGRTFMEYVRFLKISKAKELLLETDKVVRDIASDLGFDDAAYFDRVFKKEVGITPVQFRNVQKNKIEI